MASPNVYFASIPASIRKPGRYFELNTSLAVRNLPGNPQRILLIGQRLAAGTVSAGVPINIYSDTEAQTAFGVGSQLQLMVRRALAANPYALLTCCAIDDAAASIATVKTITLLAPTRAGIVSATIGGVTVSAAVAATDTATTKATALAAAINAAPWLPFTATAALGVITLTARNKGGQGNTIGISSADSSLDTAPVVASVTAGTGDPSISATLTAVFAAGHNVIVLGNADATALAALKAHLDTVSGPMEQRGAIGVYAANGTLAASTTTAATVNAGRMYCVLVPAAPESVSDLAAVYGAVIASEEDPAMPLNTLPLPTITATPLASRLGRTEHEVALYNGVTPTETDQSGVVRIVRAISTYTTSVAGVADPALLDLSSIRIYDYLRLAIIQRMALRFPRAKLSSGTDERVWSEAYDVLLKCEELEIVRDVEANKDGLICEPDSQDSARLNLRLPMRVVPGLHVIAGAIYLLL